MAINRDFFEDLFVLEMANNHWGRLERGKKIVDDFNNSSDISLSDNSFFEVLLSGGLLFFILFFLVVFHILFRSFFIPNTSIICILFYFVIGLLITTSIYFINYVFFLLLSLKSISFLLFEKNSYKERDFYNK